MAEKRITRKELLKSPDELLTLTERTVNFVSAHAKQFYIGGTVVACLLVIGLLTNWYFNHKADLAMTAYSKALDGVDLQGKASPEEISKSIQSFDKVTKDFPGSPPAHDSLLNLGQLYYESGQYDQSIAAYEKFLTETKPWEDAIKPIVQDCLADVYEANGKLEQAAKVWEDMVKTSGGMLKNEAYRGLGRVYQALGKTDQAKQAYDSYLKDFPNSAEAAQVKAKLAALTQ